MAGLPRSLATVVTVAAALVLGACSRGAAPPGSAPAPPPAPAAGVSPMALDSTVPCPPPATPEFRRGEAEPRPYFGFQVEEQAEPYGRNPKPVLGAGAAGNHGKVVAQYVVDANGLIDRRTIKMVESSGPAFTAAVCAVLPGYRFRPATLHGRAVPMVDQRSFTF